MTAHTTGIFTREITLPSLAEFKLPVIQQQIHKVIADHLYETLTKRTTPEQGTPTYGVKFGPVITLPVRIAEQVYSVTRCMFVTWYLDCQDCQVGDYCTFKQYIDPRLKTYAIIAKTPETLMYYETPTAKLTTTEWLFERRTIRLPDGQFDLWQRTH